MTSNTRILLTLAIVVFGVGIVWWFGARLPSDDEMIQNFSRKRDDFETLVEMYKTDKQNMWVPASGKTWPENLYSERGISSEREREYRELVASLGVTGVLGDGQATVEYQIYAPLMPLGPMKSYWYSEKPPKTLTSINTQQHVFLPGQFKRACRSIETNWYVCIDYED